MKSIHFKTILLSFGQNTGIEVPELNLRQLSEKNKVPVQVTVNSYVYPSTIAKMNGKFLIPFAKEHREKTGLIGGSTVEVTLTLEEGNRIVIIPPVLAKRLKSEKLSIAFERQSYSMRKEFARLILDAKKPETLEKRLTQITEILKGLPNPGKIPSK